MAAALKIQQRKIAALIPYVNNARTHSEAQVTQIAASIKEFGFTNPVLVDGENGIIAGHGRVMAAQKLGMEVVPCIELAHLSDAQRKAYIIADNKLAMNAGWNLEMLTLELGALRADGFNLDLTGFDTGELVDLFSTKVGASDPDDVPAMGLVEISRPGDVWLLGAHRLICGDSREAGTVRKLMGKDRAQMIFTDPPYGVDYTGGMKKRERLKDDDVGTKIYSEVLPHLQFAADDKAPLYLWYADAHVAAAAAAGYSIVAQIIWVKNNAQYFTAAKYKGKHEPCFYAHRTGRAARWHGPNNEVTVWEVDRAAKNEFHPTQKPTALAERAIGNSSEPGQIVLDLFSGSGSTIIAAEITGRRCFTCEIAPSYVDVAIRRWQVFTGKAATLEGTDQTFGDVALSREKAA